MDMIPLTQRSGDQDTEREDRTEIRISCDRHLQQTRERRPDGKQRRRFSVAGVKAEFQKDGLSDEHLFGRRRCFQVRGQKVLRRRRHQPHHNLDTRQCRGTLHQNAEGIWFTTGWDLTMEVGLPCFRRFLKQIQRFKALIHEDDAKRGARRQEPYRCQGQSDEKREEHEKVSRSEREWQGQDIPERQRQLHRQKGDNKQMVARSLQDNINRLRHDGKQELQIGRIEQTVSSTRDTKGLSTPVEKFLLWVVGVFGTSPSVY